MHSEEQLAAISSIHDLLADSRKDYEAASKRIPDERVHKLFHQISEDRALMEADLAKDIRHHGSIVLPGKGTVPGAIDRILLGVRDAINSTSEVNVLVECERQESALLGRYDKVLDTHDLNEDTRAVLARQQAQIAMNVAHVRILRKQLESVEH